MRKKTIVLFLPLALLLASCGPFQPLGYCPTDGMFYYRNQNNGQTSSATPQQIINLGFDPYAYGDYCPGGTPTPNNTAVLPTPTNTSVPPTATPTDTAVLPTPTNTSVPPVATPTNLPPQPIPTPIVVVAVEPKALFNMYLLTNGGWHCLLISDTHPSIERQNQACFPHLDPNWTAMNAPCAAPVFDDDTWNCDKFTPWRLPLVNLRVVWHRHLAKAGE